MGAGLAVLWMAALAGYDIRQRRLPNWLTLPGFAVIMLAAAASGHGPAAAVGAGLLGAVYLCVHLVSPTALGAGDVKLALGLGALTGCFGVGVWFLAAVGAPLLTAVIGILRGGRSVPHGPSMCLASAMAVVLGCFSPQPAQKPQESPELWGLVLPASQRQSAHPDNESTIQYGFRAPNLRLSLRGGHIDPLNHAVTRVTDEVPVVAAGIGSFWQRRR